MDKFTAYGIAAIIWTGMTVCFSWLFINPFLGSEETYREMVSNGAAFTMGRMGSTLALTGISTGFLAMGAWLEKVHRYKTILLLHILLMLTTCIVSSVLFYEEFR